MGQPAPRRLPSHKAWVRQITLELARIGAVELRGEVDDPRAARGARVRAVGVAAQMGIGKSERREAQRVARIALAFPLNEAIQEVKRDARLRKYPRQLDLALARREHHACARLIRIE